jgi:hypothetical protein
MGRWGGGGEKGSVQGREGKEGYQIYKDLIASARKVTKKQRADGSCKHEMRVQEGSARRSVHICKETACEELKSPNECKNEGTSKEIYASVHKVRGKMGKEGTATLEMVQGARRERKGKGD